MSILFSVEKYTSQLTKLEQKIIDSFFESLQWGYTRGNIRIDQIPFGELMEVVDTDNRWIYKGSQTIPPCEEAVYHNVLSTIYPISQTHIDQFKEQLARTGVIYPGMETDEDGFPKGMLQEWGNNRATQQLNDRKVYKVSRTYD